MKSLYYVCMLTLLLSGCGQKGALYLPEAKQVKQEKQHGHPIHKNAWSRQ